MKITLEDLIKGRKILLDTSYLGQKDDLAKRLYDGLWKDITESEITIRAEIINQIECLLSDNFFVIKESEIENEEGLTQLNNHLEYFGNGNCYKHNGDRVHKKHHKNTRGSWKNELSESYALFSEYVDSFHSLHRKLKNRDPRKNFRDKQKTLYQIIFTLTQIYSRDLNNLLTNSKLANYKNPLLTGKYLQTDQKIIATAFTLAFDSPVLILTRDNDFRKLFPRILDNLLNPKEHHRYIVDCMPQHQITLYGVKPADFDEISPIHIYQPNTFMQTSASSSFPNLQSKLSSKQEFFL